MMDTRPVDQLRVNASLSCATAASSSDRRAMTPTKSARAGYPCFLSLPQTVLLHAKWFCAGLLDGFRWDVVARTATR